MFVGEKKKAISNQAKSDRTIENSLLDSNEMVHI